ncbi:MAG: ribbon-helix-helix domain-containing protein [Inquilinus sp.]|uniref:ribbon-helix-helix domain-containing protein n=1 Tax=Inquilinus sp. TaxID=1932117 RepID=UPI003F403740
MLDGQTRNVLLGGRRTSIRLEAAFWSALDEILELEGISLGALVTRINTANRNGGNLSGAVRVFIISYFTALARQQGWSLPQRRDLRTSIN